MFKLRTILPSVEEAERQEAIFEVVVNGHVPESIIQKKAAAIIGHDSIKPVYQSKAYQHLNEVSRICDRLNIETDEGKTAIKNLLDNKPINIHMSFKMPRKMPILSLSKQRQRLTYRHTKLKVIAVTNVNITEFEHLIFNSKADYGYYEGFFAFYIHNNILTNSEEFSSDSWQFKVSKLIELIKFDHDLTMEMFYKDSITYDGETYDTSFIPKYDVRNLRPLDLPTQDEKESEGHLIYYHEQLDPSNVTQIPDDKRAIFVVFPFKNGYLIKADGSVEYLNFRPKQLYKSTLLKINNLCNIHDYESALNKYARNISLDEATYYAIYSKGLNEQAIALSLIKRINGDTLTLGDHLIEIASELTLLSWTKYSCSSLEIILPPYYEFPKNGLALNLVEDISQSCVSKLGACVLSSMFHLPEVSYAFIFKEIESSEVPRAVKHGRLYVLYTMIYQDYLDDMYERLRDRLDPSFGKNNIELDIYSTFKYKLNQVNNNFEDKSPEFFLTDEFSACAPDICYEMYEFVDKQLNNLVRYSDVKLNKEQKANLIALLVQD